MSSAEHSRDSLDAAASAAKQQLSDVSAEQEDGAFPPRFLKRQRSMADRRPRPHPRSPVSGDSAEGLADGAEAVDGAAEAALAEAEAATEAAVADAEAAGGVAADVATAAAAAAEAAGGRADAALPAESAQLAGAAEAEAAATAAIDAGVPADSEEAAALELWAEDSDGEDSVDATELQVRCHKGFRDMLVLLITLVARF